MVDHIHCLICGKPHILREDECEERPNSYICVACAKTFESDYILHRILCQKNGIHLSQFDLLEERLTRGTRYEEDKENGYVDTYVF